MSRQERYGTRDLTYSAWHRKLADDLTYIDVDGLEYCARCREPLGLFEMARDVGQAFKPTPVLRKLAARSQVAAYCALYEPAGPAEIRGFRVQQLYPLLTGLHRVTPEDFAGLLRLLRERHQCDTYPSSLGAPEVCTPALSAAGSTAQVGSGNPGLRPHLSEAK